MKPKVYASKIPFKTMHLVSLGNNGSLWERMLRAPGLSLPYLLFQVFQNPFHLFALAMLDKTCKSQLIFTSEIIQIKTQFLC